MPKSRFIEISSWDTGLRGIIQRTPERKMNNQAIREGNFQGFCRGCHGEGENDVEPAGGDDHDARQATRAENDEQMLGSWLANLTSAHSRRNFEVTARRFMKLRIKDLAFWPAENPGRRSGRRR